MIDVKKCLASHKLSIMETVSVIDASGIQTALIVDDDERLLGIFTDGDLRRAVLRNVDLKRNITEVMKVHPVTVVPGTNTGVIQQLMKERIIHHIPVVDKSNRVLRIISDLDLLQKNKVDNIVVLMLGGLGTRLRPLTDECPKPLLKVGGKPVLETILESFISNGFHEFYFSVNYRADMIERHFANGENWGVNITYIREEMRMGTAGSLGLLPIKPTAPVVVMNGDILTKIDFQKLLDYHISSNAEATMAVRQHEITVPYGVIDIEDMRIRRIIEKPVQKFMVNAGIYVLNASALETISGTEYLDMPVLYETLLMSGKNVAAYPINDYWIDIGKMDDLRQAQTDYESIWS